MVNSIRIVAILSGCDWADASCTHLTVPPAVDLDVAKESYRRWYTEEYVAGGCRGTFYTFPDWLKARYGATDADVEEYEDM